MIKQRLEDLLGKAASSAQAAGKLPVGTLPENIIERPQNPEHGDYASSLPLKLAPVAGRSPLDIAQDIAGFIPAAPELESVAVAPPGFINFKLKGDWLARQVDFILQAGDRYGVPEVVKHRANFSKRTILVDMSDAPDRYVTTG